MFFAKTFRDTYQGGAVPWFVHADRPQPASYIAIRRFQLLFECASIRGVQSEEGNKSVGEKSD